ncbi:GNAT family N-acetyltransferase [Acaryochloris thomasi]|uniref:GNAT family N-acetyltransferase n=1 Tax=Acaryochloris thomasi TaxID=2929456 RepID=UPI000DA69264|nr:GNAT family N-acetyltransferase [Acaryochloris thomasi]
MVREAIPQEDHLLALHFYQLWRDNQVPEQGLIDDWLTVTVEFIANARKTLNYRAFVVEVEGRVVGSVGCQLFDGLYPLILAETQRKYGYIWGVYVEPDYRGQGIGTRLTEMAVEYLRSQHCTRAILHASPSGQPVYEHLGFIPSNEMRLDLCEQSKKTQP